MAGTGWGAILDIGKEVAIAKVSSEAAAKMAKYSQPKTKVVKRVVQQKPAAIAEKSEGFSVPVYVYAIVAVAVIAVLWKLFR